MMNQLIKRQLVLEEVPEVLIPDFESMVFKAYFDSYYVDIWNLAVHVDIFSVYTYSLETYGDPYYVHNNEALSEDQEDAIVTSRFENIQKDTRSLLDYHNIFYSHFIDLDNDDDPYNLQRAKCSNYPSIQIW